jgi:hypothetical protein
VIPKSPLVGRPSGTPRLSAGLTSSLNSDLFRYDAPNPKDFSAPARVRVRQGTKVA